MRLNSPRRYTRRRHRPPRRRRAGVEATAVIAGAAVGRRRDASDGVPQSHLLAHTDRSAPQLLHADTRLHSVGGRHGPQQALRTLGMVPGGHAAGSARQVTSLVSQLRASTQRSNAQVTSCAWISLAAQASTAQVAGQLATWAPFGSARHAQQSLKSTQSAAVRHSAPARVPPAPDVPPPAPDVPPPRRTCRPPPRTCRQRPPCRRHRRRPPHLRPRRRFRRPRSSLPSRTSRRRQPRRRRRPFRRRPPRRYLRRRPALRFPFRRTRQPPAGWTRSRF